MFEVDRTINACGLVSLAGRQHPIGYQFAGRRLTIRISGALLHLTDGHTLLRTLPNPHTETDLAQIRDARPAGPEPQPATEPLQAQRRVSSRGQIVIAEVARTTTKPIARFKARKPEPEPERKIING
ncbi:hypothetical protein AB0L06_42610 [Spirillospora sp. NPDC052269]